MYQPDGSDRESVRGPNSVSSGGNWSVAARAADLLAKAPQLDGSTRTRASGSYPEGVGVRFVLFDGPEDGGTGFANVFVDPTLDGVVDVEEPHGGVTSRTAGPGLDWQAGSER